MAKSRTQRTVTIGEHRLRLTNADKVLYPASGTTKADVQEYLAAVAHVLLPHAAWRPVTRKRWPDGVGTADDPKKPFFRKDLEDSAPRWIPRMRLKHSDHTNTYPLANHAAALAWLGQVAALEIHVPQWRFSPDGAQQNPDRLVLDLDPGPGTGLLECAELARLCRALLTDMGLDSFPVTSGSKGIHLYAALDGSHTTEQISSVAHEFARAVEADHPDLAVSDMKKELRRGKVLIDWSQNSASKTTVCPYSLRGKDWPYVAAPRTWEELDDPELEQLDMTQVMERVAAGTDPIAPLGVDADTFAEADSGSGTTARSGTRTGAEPSHPASDRLSSYRSKRDQEKTPEPVPVEAPTATGRDPIFVIQEHHARALHFDTRIEYDDVLVSWAVPKGPPLKTGVNRLAVQTEDHPLEYATFEGTIPKGEYGGGEVSIWDTGTVTIEKWKTGREVIAVLQGQPDGGLGGEPRRFALVHTDDKRWLMTLMKDQSTKKIRLNAQQRDATGKTWNGRLPSPMLATAGAPRDMSDHHEWVFEGKWDGYRAVVGVRADAVEVRSRNGHDLTATFPELGELADLAAPGTVFDGEVVALDRGSRPNFGLLQTRGKLTGTREIARAMRSTPVHYFVFDVLRTPDEHGVQDLPYVKRRELLGDVLTAGDHVHIPDVVGTSADSGLEAALETSRELSLEGVVAKRSDSTYRAGRRAGTWLKLKHDTHQEVVIIGWRQGKGGYSTTFGSLLLAVPEGNELESDDLDGDESTRDERERKNTSGPLLRYAGRVGTGFSDAERHDLRARLDRMTRKTPGTSDIPASDQRDVQWVTPRTVGEISHSGITRDGRFRHAVWRGLRPDKEPFEVRWE